MHLQSDTEKLLAKALYDAGQSDREIADACHTSVNNVIWWRRDAGLHEHGAAAQQVEARPAPVHRAADAPARRRPDVPSDFGFDRQSLKAVVDRPVPGLISPAEAQALYTAPVKPDGDNALEIGRHLDDTVYVDLAELLTTRLLIQGNSGSGKTHLLRRLLEECAGIVQQVIVDPEGDFISFGDAFGHTIIKAAKNSKARLATIAGRVRHLRGSVVLSLEGLGIEQQMEAASAFLDGLFDAPAEDWHPVIVAVDEAHLFAPATDNGEDREIRKLSQQAMANLMCRGRKRGLAGIIATQRLAKLAKNVAAEASNFLMGRTFLDIDMARAADLLGMSRVDSEKVRNLGRGDFLGLGPAIARRPILVTVGAVITAGKAGVEKGITPLPSLKPEEMQSLLLADDEPVEPEAGYQEDTTVVRFAARGAKS